MVESKRAICSYLTNALQVTAKCKDLVLLRYERAADYTETVTAIYAGGDRKKMDVTFQDGFGMIKEIIDRLT